MFITTNEVEVKELFIYWLVLVFFMRKSNILIGILIIGLVFVSGCSFNNKLGPGPIECDDGRLISLGERCDYDIKFFVETTLWGSYDEGSELYSEIYYVNKNEQFGPKIFMVDNPFKLVKIIDNNNVLVKFNDWLVFAGDPIDEDSLPNPIIISDSEKCFRTPTYDAGVDVCIRIISDSVIKQELVSSPLENISLIRTSGFTSPEDSFSDKITLIFGSELIYKRDYQTGFAPDNSQNLFENIPNAQELADEIELIILKGDLLNYELNTGCYVADAGGKTLTFVYNGVEYIFDLVPLTLCDDEIDTSEQALLEIAEIVKERGVIFID